jgi:hypothetical protein
MYKYLFFLLSFCAFGFLSAEEMPKDLPSLKKLLDERMWQYEEGKKLLTDSSDIYTYYMIFGKQMAYQEVLILLDKMIIENNL